MMMMMVSVHVVLLVLVCVLWAGEVAEAAPGSEHLSVFPKGCDQEAALQCEYDFLLCKLFGGPANDAPTLCRCAKEFYGSCLRLAGCETAKEVGPLTAHEIYMRTCVDFIMKNNCPDPLICGINCAAPTQIDQTTTKIIPFNNYGKYYLRIRTCLYKVHDQRYKRYSNVEQVACKTLDDFKVCNRWIPPSTYAPVALPIDTTYIEIDSCEIVGNGTYSCRSADPAPSRVYGNAFLFPKSFDVAQTSESVCAKDNDCLGTFCDFQYNPPICSPKKIYQVLSTGSEYMTIR